jgi:hypothetical protein
VLGIRPSQPFLTDTSTPFSFSYNLLYILGDKDRQLNWPSKCGSYLQLFVARQDNRAQDLLGFRISESLLYALNVITCTNGRTVARSLSAQDKT